MGASYSRYMNPMSLCSCKPSKTKSIGSRSISSITGSGRQGLRGTTEGDNLIIGSSPSIRITRQASRISGGGRLRRSSSNVTVPRRSARLSSLNLNNSINQQQQLNPIIRPIQSHSSLNEAMNLQSRLRRSARIARLNVVGSNNHNNHQNRNVINRGAQRVRVSKGRAMNIRAINNQNRSGHGFRRFP